MKFNVNIALRYVAAIAVCAVATNAFAFGGLFESGFPNGSAHAAADDSFFGGEPLTFGDMNAAGYEVSALDGAYAQSAEFAGEAEYISYGYPVSYSYGYADTGWTVYRPFTPVRTALRIPGAALRISGAALRVPGAALRGVRNLLFGTFNYCRPAYVCDPCWTICDGYCCDWTPCAPLACDPCAPLACEPACDPCAPLACEPVCDPCEPAVFAPRSCCGDGYAPGKTNALNPETGLSGRGIDSRLDSPTVAPAATPAPTELDTESPLDTEGPAALPTFDSAPESVPANKVSASFIKMLVPEDSVVYVNGYRTKQTGALRTFAARDLEVGETYEFEIRVVAVRNGKVFEDVQTTTLTAGDSTALAFNLTLRQDEAYAYNR